MTSTSTYVDRKTGTELRGWQDCPPSTLEQLKKQHTKYPERKRDRRGKFVDTVDTYKTWRVMKAKDAIIEVGLYTLSREDAYELVKHMTKNPKIREQAFADIFAEDEEEE